MTFRPPVFKLFEHKIEVFVRFCPPKPSFSSLSSTKSAFLCSSRGTSGIGKRKSNFPAIHRAGQCAPVVPRTRIRARGDLQELCHGQPAASFATQHFRPWLATASSSTQHPRTQPGSSLIIHRIPAPRPGDSLIIHRIPAPRPCNSLIRRRYVGGVGNRCRWADRFAMSEQRLQGGSKVDVHLYE